MKRLLLAATALLALAVTPAGATTINANQIGQSGTVSFDGRIDDVTDPVAAGLGTNVTLTLTGHNTQQNTWTFGYSVTNTSTLPAYQTWGFGFNTSPLIQNASMTGSVFNQAQVGGIVDGGINTSSFCGNAGLNCLFGAGDGLAQGATTTGTLTLDLVGQGDSFNLTGMFVLYEQPFPFALHDAVGLQTGQLNLQAAVPEASTWFMMIVGFLGLGLLGARQKLGGVRLA
jgi:hypothetical protein